MGRKERKKNNQPTNSRIKQPQKPPTRHPRPAMASHPAGAILLVIALCTLLGDGELEGGSEPALAGGPLFYAPLSWEVGLHGGLEGVGCSVGCPWSGGCLCGCQGDANP